MTQKIKIMNTDSKNAETKQCTIPIVRRGSFVGKKFVKGDVVEIDNLDLAIKKRNKLIKTIRDEISDFERNNGKLSYEDEI